MRLRPKKVSAQVALGLEFILCLHVTCFGLDPQERRLNIPHDFLKAAAIRTTQRHKDSQKQPQERRNNMTRHPSHSLRVFRPYGKREDNGLKRALQSHARTPARQQSKAEITAL